MAVPSSINRKFSFVFASTNRGKLKEVTEICSSVLGWHCIDPQSLIERCGPIPEVIEGMESYKENALLKAKAFFDWARLPVIADDTGLEVRSLYGAPGVKSARYAGETASMKENKQKLLEDLRQTPDRTAQFRCVLCLIMQDKMGNYAETFAEATLSGAIKKHQEGIGGFGYDDLFLVDGQEGATLASLKESGYQETHRYRSFLKLAEMLS